MGKLLLRLVVKQIAKIRTKQPNLGKYLLETFRTKHKAYIKPVFGFPNAQVDGAILHTFLGMLEEANLPDENYHSLSAKIKLIEIYSGINNFVNHEFEMRKINPSKEISMLEEDHSYKILKEKDKEFVKSIIKKVFEGEETYSIRNLTDFFKNSKSARTNIQQRQLLDKVRPEIKEYIQSVLDGKIKSPITKSYFNAYDTIFNVKELSEYDKVFESYINSKYILLDFDNINLGKS